MKQFYFVELSLLFKLAVLFSCLCAPLSQGQGLDAVEQQYRYEQLRQRLLELEEARGNFHPALIEPLLSLANSAAALNMSDESVLLQSRAIHIQKQAFGLFNADQIPLYFDLIKYDSATGDWSRVNQSMNHLSWLLLDKQVSDGEPLIEYLIQLSEHHLLSVARDDAQQQANHFLQAEKMLSMAIQVSEDFWGPADLRLTDLYYSRIKHIYLQSAALERGGETAYSLRMVVPGGSIVRPEKDVQSSYYAAGLRLYRDIQRNISASLENPAEAIAMVDLYRADWHLLFNKVRAQASYQAALDDLLNVGVDQDDLNHFFSQPQIVPLPVFFHSVDQASSAMDLAMLAGQDGNEFEIPGVIQFRDWFDSMPFVSFPVTSPSLDQSSAPEYTTVLVHFRLNSLQNVSRWVQGTYRTRSGVVESFSMLNESDGQAVDIEYLGRRLHFLHFRPRMEGGIVRPYQGTLLYSMAVE